MDTGNRIYGPAFNEEMPMEEPYEEMNRETDAMQQEEEPREDEQHEQDMHEEEPHESSSVQVEYFSANPPEIMYGECSLLEWRIEGQADFELNGYPIGNYDTMEVCPEETKTYELIIWNNGKESKEKVEVSVIRNPVD